MGDFATLDGPNVRPLRAELAAAGFDAHRETPQDNHFVALRDKILRLKCENILHLGEFAEELPDPFATVPCPGKRHVLHFRQLPLNIGSERIQERCEVARFEALISLLDQSCVFLFYHDDFL